MTTFLSPLLRLTTRNNSHKLKSLKLPCALVSCTRSQSYWHHLRDRFSRNGTLLQDCFYCHPHCLETALINQLTRLQEMVPTPHPANRIPLGLLMVARGKLTFAEVRAALEAQRSARYGKIGEWIEKLGFATENDVTTALALQWGCPVATSVDPSTVHSFANIPLPILEAFQMLPLSCTSATNTLYVAFGERVDHAALYAIEKILVCRTQPCVSGRKRVARQLESMHQLSRPSDVEFGPMGDLAEMARIAASYTAKLSPEEIRLSRIGQFIWLRLNIHSASHTETRSVSTNLVFRLSADIHPASTFDPSRHSPELA
jgi:hypothetical protein